MVNLKLNTLSLVFLRFDQKKNAKEPIGVILHMRIWANYTFPRALLIAHAHVPSHNSNQTGMCLLNRKVQDQNS